MVSLHPCFARLYSLSAEYWRAWQRKPIMPMSGTSRDNLTTLFSPKNSKPCSRYQSNVGLGGTAPCE
jgi:hypothetical protein